VNLYFNKHLDLDLSEQQLVSCSGAGGCSGGSPPAALFYIANAGVVDEACFPETGRDDPCGNMCASPEQTILIGGYEDINPWDGADNIKERLIKHGPLNFGIVSWWHAIVLVGYDTDLATSEPIWILKNSWGQGWGENGYFKMKVDLSDIYLTDNLLLPFTSRLKSYEIACRDEDHDGYSNWGTSSEKPPSCGNVPLINDCNDWDPGVALQQSDGSCVAACKGLQIESLVATPDVLWPPNHKMAAVKLFPTTKDDCDPNPVCRVQSVTSTEPPGDEPDWTINDDLTVNLRAARSAKDRGRVYSITVTCTDKAGNQVITHQRP
jgi:hypothetical protein